MTAIPQHVAIIMDGNGRWAKMRHLPKIAGHRAGVQSVRQAIEAAKELGVKVLTLYTFSTENWKRPKNEVDALFRLLEEYLDREEKRLKENNIKLSVMGDMSKLPEGVRRKLSHAIASTADNTGLTLKHALEKIEKEIQLTEEVSYLVNFIKTSQRGIAHSCRKQ